MDEIQTNNNHDLAHGRYRTLLLLMLGAFFLSIAIGGIGGYLVLVANDWGGIPRILVAAPGIIAIFMFAVPIYFIRKRWFPTRESLIAASNREPPGS